VRIVGLGSPHGDDRVGWEVVTALAGASLPPRVELRMCATPATDLIPALCGAKRAVLVDAVAGAPAGTVLRGGRGALAAGRAGLSSHGVAIGTLLDLAEACGVLPAELAWVGVTVDAARCKGEATSAAVTAALPALVQAAIEEAQR
jgi:hydrogenase maturation protease